MKMLDPICTCRSTPVTIMCVSAWYIYMALMILAYLDIYHFVYMPVYLHKVCWLCKEKKITVPIKTFSQLLDYFCTVNRQIYYLLMYYLKMDTHLSSFLELRWIILKKPALESSLGRSSTASNVVRSLIKIIIGWKRCQINIWYIIG